MLSWRSEHPPIYVKTFEVLKTCEFLRPHFKFFRENLVHLEVSPSMSFSRTIAPYSTDLHKLQHLEKLFKKWHTQGMAAYPRGSLDAEIVICGIAPGYTAESYYECMWLLGPSSKLLYANLLGTPVYFTNVCKASFRYNKYSPADIIKWFESFYEELEILSPKTVVFLGKYRVYEEIRLPDTIKKVQVYHPSFFLRRRDYKNGTKYIKEALELSSSKDEIDADQYWKLSDGIYVHKELEDVYRR